MTGSQITEIINYRINVLKKAIESANKGGVTSVAWTLGRVLNELEELLAEIT